MELEDNEIAEPRRKKKRVAVNWKCEEKDMEDEFKKNEFLTELEDDFPLLTHMTTVEIFKVFFNQNIIDLIVKETKRYASLQNYHDFSFNETDLLLFIAILFMTGYNKRKQEYMYWSNDKDLESPLIKSLMSSKRFKSIKRFLHFCNNNELNKNDKFTKIRPLVIETNKSLSQFGYFSKFLSIDEQYIKSKPIKFGFKSLVICDEHGYPFQFLLYQGAETIKSSVPLGTRVVLGLTNNIKN